MDKQPEETPEDEELPEFELSESGTPILRHLAPDNREALFEMGAQSLFTEAIEAHVERHIGSIGNVFHELISPLVHIDILCVPPTDERPFHTLVTCGMSAKPMSVPPEIESRLGFDARYAELLVCLPPEWKLDEASFRDEANYWPIRWLKTLARLPHEYNTWLWEGHTVPNGDPARPFAPNTRLCCTMLAPPLSLQEEAHTLQAEDEDGQEASISFFAMQTLYADEVAFKLKSGGDALFEVLDGNDVGDVLDIARPSVVPARRSWWKRG